MKFVLLVEGDTEKLSIGDFLKRWLDPLLNQRVGIQVIQFSGYADLARKIVKKAQTHLDGPNNSEIIAVVGLLDLYGPDFYPKGLDAAKDRHIWAVQHFQKEVNRERFRMFFAVHEFEAWLLSQPSIFPNDIRSKLEKIHQPEQVNFDKPPAKVLDSLYKQAFNRSYKKTTYGPTLFAKLDPQIAASKCPQLKSMLEELLKLAKDKGL